MITLSTFQFLRKLNRNNNRKWFHEHRAEYTAAKQNVLAAASELLPEINQFDPIGFFDVRKGMFRIARDTRFSPDKAPYKTNFGVILNDEGTTRCERAGYYLHIEPSDSFLSCGLYMPSPAILKAVRTAIVDDFEAFREITEKTAFRDAFAGLVRDPDVLTRVPQGFDKRSPAAEFLKLKHLYIMTPLSEKQCMDPSFIKKAAGLYRLMTPFKHFLNEAIKEL
jgi:uncharacterized protein (TIGR02453 family)